MHKPTIDYYNQNMNAFKQLTKPTNASVHTEESHLLFKEFISLLKEGDTILDLGCGYGRTAAAFLERGIKVIGIDASIAMVNEASKVLGQENVYCQNFEEVSFKENAFDAIWACASLLHYPRDKFPSLLMKLQPMHKTGGVFYMNFQHGDGELVSKKNGCLFSNYNDQSFAKVVKKTKGYEIINSWVSADARKGFEHGWFHVLMRKN